VFLRGSVVADQVTLKNGDQLTGAIVKSDAKTLLIKTEFAGEVSVQWDAVTRHGVLPAIALCFETDRRSSDSEATDNKFDVATKETGPVTASKDAVPPVSNNAEQKAYDEQVERLRHPHLAGFLERGCWTPASA